MFYTLQGEGLNAGRPAVFCRFSGCNLWSGREVDRAKAICKFCDTDFVGIDGVNGGRFGSADALADAISSVWSATSISHRFVVLTGGEPLLQVDAPLIDALHTRAFEIALETNGTITPPEGIDWVCISPKAGTTLVVTSGHELKLIYPQEGIAPRDVEHLDFGAFLLQPMDSPSVEANTRDAIRYCQEFPKWRLSLQQHKILRIR
jgi:7-carboxy-7-deazaguanine synthase (Cx14CxxC type)